LHIVVVANTYPSQRRPASEPSYTALAQELARRGHVVSALACAEEGQAAHEEIGGVHVVRALERVSATDTRDAVVARACRALRKLMKREPGGAVVVFADAGDLPAALLGVPEPGRGWVDLGYDWPLTGFAASHPWWAHALTLGGMARLKARTLGAAIEPPDVQSYGFLLWRRERWEELLVRGLPVQSAKVLRPGVDTHLFGYRDPAPTDDEVRLQYQGPLRREGGLNALFLALQRLPSQVRLRIVAESTEASYLAELGELGRAAGVMERVDVTPAPGEAQRLSLLREAHVFVHAFESADAFPRYALEAAAAGVPVVAARVTGAEADDWPWGEGAAQEFPAGDPNSLATCLRQVLERPREAVARARRARRLVEDRYGVRYSVDQLEPLLDGA
jgi:glycosyltransferase involved in cell wall biosynthesis